MATFKARARALDMLGRQQIAGIPTAISELFKNAHDAYANRVEVDLLRAARVSDHRAPPHDVFILRDDGIGMTEDEFLQRWLTLGTESKVQNAGALSAPYRPPGEAPRPPMGEKGIGRLAIASIGPMVLVLTRARRAHVLHDLVAAFIAWPLFECPGIDLDEIRIPMKTFPGGMLPGREDVAELVGEVKTNILDLQSRLEPDRVIRLLDQLEQFAIDPRRIAAVLGEPTLANSGSGTHFIVMPAEEILLSDLDELASADEKNVPRLFKLLVGFTNTMVPRSGKPRITTAFRDRRRPDLPTDVIAEHEFFSPTDFKAADHTFEGCFDEFGHFSGKLRIFEERLAYELPSKLGKRTPASCGPFSIALAYVQGIPEQSLSFHRDPEEHGRLLARLERIGGLYIYRDGIRILPYGDNEHDFLDIERRRSKKADYYYFSYRRMFGAIDLTRAENGKLEEKAGREGFRENKAYRQFKDILIHFFVQLAAEFFRKEGARSEIFHTRRDELSRNEVIRRDHEMAAGKKRKLFAAELETAFEKLHKAEPRREIDALLSDLTGQLSTFRTAADTDHLDSMLLGIDTNARRQLDAIRKQYRIIKPRGLALNTPLQREMDAYQDELRALERDLFLPARERMAVLIAKAAADGHYALDRRRRLEQSLSGEIKRTRQGFKEELSSAEKAATALQEQARRVLRDVSGSLEGEIASSLEHIAGLNLTGMTDEQVAAELLRLEEGIAEASERGREQLTRVREMLYATTAGLGVEGTAAPDLAEALEEEVLALRERADSDLALLQLGMAIEVINHEFTASIKAVRNALRRLKSWADANPKLLAVHRDLRASFDHLDNYLTLFTPLQRRLYRTPTRFTGADIEHYLRDLFTERLERDNIAIRATDAFRAHELTSYPSTFYPVFVNLVDNALFWLRGRPDPRVVSLESDGSAMFVVDTGPGISTRDREAVFELGFTRKPGGRGMGLHVSREVLRKAHYGLTLEEPEAGTGAKFRIEPGVVDRRE